MAAIQLEQLRSSVRGAIVQPGDEAYESARMVYNRMIDKVTFEETTFLDAPARFEAGTPHIVGAVGLHAAIDWTTGIGLDALHDQPAYGRGPAG